MACRKGELREEGKSRSAAAAAAAPLVAVGDALLFTTMCIIGMPVDVHAKDGSVYSGIFHTASVDKDYAVVLKNAKMIKKGNLEANVVNGTLIETLIVQSNDLVQVVAKAGGDSIEAAAGYIECLNKDAEVVKPNESRGNKKHKSQTRFAAKRENGFSHTNKPTIALGSSPEDHNERLDARKFVKIEVAHTLPVDGRQGGDGSPEMQSDTHNIPEFQDKGATNEVQGSRLSITTCEAQSAAAVNTLEDTMQQEPKGLSLGSHALEDQRQDRSDEIACTVATATNISVASVPVIDVKSESCLSASSNPFLLVPPKNSGVKKTAKEAASVKYFSRSIWCYWCGFVIDVNVILGQYVLESKLNPGAKIFSPSMSHHRTATSPAMPNGASVPYLPSTYTMAPMATAQEEVDASSFAHSPLPVKFAPFNNVAVGNGGSDAPYVQPIIGQVVNRTPQPFRYTGQYQNFQASPAYGHPNVQNVMFGRGPVVCMHPISSDVVQSAAGFSPATARPLLTPHQVHLPKHQGTASAQALQLCMAPPILASGPQPFVMPSSIPIQQPLFPVLRPIAVPGANGFLSTKFA
ncbi:Polyadenylate-binding protein-interacting protein 4 [Sesamum angolense]|uniref:Polyadenylate-binding protein-interacting protein 4 n=1 Tax=Sesamum angolense TaxID=2727404 RepID=A0AAE1WS57_9LAMI|nr:Polyadenylate-binding protein-interacting protein 4 [Sesamum angolense]